jgi:creatinine amidohydrolase
VSDGLDRPEQTDTTVREVRWERMFPDELERAFHERPVAYLTYGLCEPHGPQNAVGLDSLKAHAIACRAARAHGGIVAPPDFWHIHELGGYAAWSHGAVGQVDRSWLTCMPPWVHFKNVCYHVRQLEVLGFRAAILITGHYGPNWQDLNRIVELLQGWVAVRLHALPDFEANQPGFPGDGKSGDHAGKVETSLLWALEPECVDVSRLPSAGDPGQHFAMGPDAHAADRRVGERMVADEVRWLGAKAQELLDVYDPTVAPRRLLTFGDVERFWGEMVEPELASFRTMQELWTGNRHQEPVPADSVWHTNWRIPPAR